jgi:predicted nuclease of predicted toxin-antitoxin system
MGALHVVEARLDRAADYEILDFADRGNWTCVTLDHDFHLHLALNRAGRPSVVFLRVERLGSEEQATLIRKIWDKCESSIDRGAAVSADTKSIRIRLLPLR